jgi:hypothetical protein
MPICLFQQARFQLQHDPAQVLEQAQLQDERLLLAALDDAFHVQGGLLDGINLVAPARGSWSR